jgi:hypothetical protein
LEVHHSKIVINPKWFRDWADKRNLKVEKDCCGDPVIYGMYGHLSVYYTTETKKRMVCVALDRASDPKKKNLLLRAKPDLVTQECDFEIVVAVDVKNSKYLTKAIKLLQIPKVHVPKVSKKVREQRSKQARKMREIKAKKAEGVKRRKKGSQSAP